MQTKIVKIDGNKIQAVVDNDIKEFELESWVKPEFVKIGDAEITIKDEKVTFVSMNQSTPAEKKTETKQSSDVVNIQGKDFMTYEGLLAKAHVKDPNFSMKIIESWVSEDMKRAWCKVRLVVGNEGSPQKEQMFDGFGSSTPENTGQMTQSHPVEMSHTR